jgi:glycosyltransferase involved in cell wall biosynthesis
MEFKMKKVSVIIPVYNAENTIKNCIDSVLLQDYPNIEIIVVDDGSSDRSLEVLKKIELNESKVKVLTQSNTGACVARNKGLELSSGQYIKFLDSDDHLLPRVIKKQVEFAELEENHDKIVYGDFYIVKNAKKIYRNTYLDPAKQTANLFFKDILTSTPLHRRWMLEKVNGFDERFKNGQEWNLHVRLSSEGFFFQHMNLPIYNYCIHDSEHRISVQAFENKSKFEYALKKLEMTKERLGAHCKGDIDSALAGGYWSIGRKFYRAGDNLSAMECVSKAKSTSNNYTLYMPTYYKILYFTLGFRLTEHLFKLAYKFKRNQFL